MGEDWWNFRFTRLDRIFLDDRCAPADRELEGLTKEFNRQPLAAVFSSDEEAADGSYRLISGLPPPLSYQTNMEVAPVSDETFQVVHASRSGPPPDNGRTAAPVCHSERSGYPLAGGGVRNR